jgi:TonB family protein
VKLPSRPQDQRWRPIEWDKVPSAFAIAWASLAHLLAFCLIFFFWHAEKAHVVPEQYQTSQIISGPVYLSSSSIHSNGSSIHSRRARLHNRAAKAVLPPEPGSAAPDSATQALRQEAKKETAEITQDLKFRQIYGFSLKHKYGLPSHAAGELPYISSNEVPPHFEQYVIVEVTIDVDGHVADARVVTGIVPRAIEEKLLSAIHEFKYSPATRDGVPIPSQLDVVVHVPS